MEFFDHGIIIVLVIAAGAIFWLAKKYFKIDFKNYKRNNKEKV